MTIKLADDSFTSDPDGAAIPIHSQIESPIGAPLESINPLGTDVHFMSAVLLSLSAMVGVGVISTPGVVVQVVGSLGLAFLLWILGSLVTFCGLASYMELASRFPGRSEGDAVFLEQAYPRPRYMVATVFGLFSAMRYNAAISATVFAEYAMHALDVPVTSLRHKSLTVAMITLVLGLCALSTRWSLKVVNGLGFLKLASMTFIIFSGFAVLLGVTRIQNPADNLRNPFLGSNWGANTLVSGYIKVDYAFGGWNQAIIFLSEVSTSQKITTADGSPGPATTAFSTIRRATYVAVALASIIFLLINLSFFAALPKESLSRTDSLVGVLFCEQVYGTDSFVATRLFPAMVALSCLGSMVAHALSQARLVRETARQGVLPYPELLSSTWPFGTPVGPLAVQWVISVLVIVIPPAASSFSFLVSMHMYPTNVFQMLTALGVWTLRAQLDIVETFHAWTGFVVIFAAKCFLTVIMPWIPPAGGPQTGNPGTWYATYCLVGIGIISLGIVYYLSWMVVLPRLGGYTIVEETVTMEGGALTNKFKKSKREAITFSPDNEHRLPLMDG
ncbi:hypothetical protein FRB94_013232 [Tulasnella sp. JGI-2019a]|nr:hypothetical protein FRB94_013232 [Tulasnella sp. JGI-2019a]